MKKKFYAVGKVFKRKGKTFLTVASDEYNCAYCAFLGCPCGDILCFSCEREDENNVHFEEVKDNDRV